jgi:hypothetical protein
MQKIPMAFHALVVFKRLVCFFPLLGMVVVIHGKMRDNILYAVQSFHIEKIDCVVGSRQVAVHAVCHKTLGVVDMSGGLPSVVSELNFVTGSAEFRCGRSDQGVVGHAKNRKAQKNAQGNQKKCLGPRSHITASSFIWRKVKTPHVDFCWPVFCCSLFL